MSQNASKCSILPTESDSAREQVSCPICGPKPTLFIGKSNNLPIVSCCGCDLVFVAEYVPMDSTLDFFRDKHMKDSDATRINYVNYRQKSLTREAARIRSLVPQGGRLLDVGTASGFFLLQFQGQTDWQVEGVEPSRVSAEFARREFDLKIHDGFLSDHRFPEAAFDVVCSLDAFGCHRQPREDMQEFYRIVAPGGLLAIEIPGHRFRVMLGSGLLHRKSKENSLRLHAGVNFFYYTRSTLTRLASLAGFEFVESHPEAMPSTGSRVNQWARNVYNIASGALYRATNGDWNISAKELIIFRKPHAKFEAASPRNAAERSSGHLRVA
jgi:SAM-dependent methyltransferase